MGKIAFIIPGYGYSGKEKEYQKIAGFFKKKKIKPVVVDIDWTYRTMSQYVAQFEEQYEKFIKNGDKVYFLGFSFGAMVACISSAKFKPEMQVLCSLSPYFKEDTPNIKKWWRNLIGKRRMDEFDKLSFVNIAKKINCKTFILAGDAEGPEVERRAKDAHKKIAKNELFFLKGVKHDISGKRYLEKIGKIISEIR